MEFDNPNIPPQIKNSNIPWENWEKEYLRANWGKAECTGSSIGRHLCRTRNAVAGQAFRLGLSQKDPNKVRTELQRQAQRMRALRHFEEAGKPTYAIGDLMPSHGDNPVTISELEHHHCRWPVKGWGHTMVYCGGVRGSPGPYCARHAASSTRYAGE